jgi:hypothetical protein
MRPPPLTAISAYWGVIMSFIVMLVYSRRVILMGGYYGIMVLWYYGIMVLWCYGIYGEGYYCIMVRLGLPPAWPACRSIVKQWSIYSIE